MVRRFTARAAAIALLLLVCVDLGIPSLCRAEPVPPAPPEAAAWKTAPDGAQRAPAVPAAGEEDCFCCCPHVRPAAPVILVSGFAPLPAELPPEARSVPQLLPHAIFHPPQR